MTREKEKEITAAIAVLMQYIDGFALDSDDARDRQTLTAIRTVIVAARRLLATSTTTTACSGQRPHHKR